MHVADFKSDTWRRFTAELRLRLQDLREQNDSVTHDERKTAEIRGRIAEVKRLLDLADDSVGSGDNPLLNTAGR